MTQKPRKPTGSGRGMRPSVVSIVVIGLLLLFALPRAQVG